MGLPVDHNFIYLVQIIARGTGRSEHPEPENIRNSGFATQPGTHLRLAQHQISN